MLPCPHTPTNALMSSHPNQCPSHPNQCSHALISQPTLPCPHIPTNCHSCVHALMPSHPNQLPCGACSENIGVDISERDVVDNPDGLKYEMCGESCIPGGLQCAADLQVHCLLELHYLSKRYRWGSSVVEWFKPKCCECVVHKPTPCTLCGAWNWVSFTVQGLRVFYSVFVVCM